MNVENLPQLLSNCCAINDELLFLACESGDIDTIKQFAGLESKTTLNRMLKIAYQNQYPEICLFLNYMGADFLHRALLYSTDVDEAKKLLVYGANVEYVDENDRTALNHAVRKNDVKMAELLLNRGANMHVLDKQDHSPFMLSMISEEMQNLFGKYC